MDEIAAIFLTDHPPSVRLSVSDDRREGVGDTGNIASHDMAAPLLIERKSGTIPTRPHSEVAVGHSELKVAGLTSGVRDVFKHHRKAPDLSDKITIQRLQAVHASSFSSVYRGEFKQGDRQVRLFDS
jgi:hypothetical protein